MANIKSSAKDARRSARRRVLNRYYRTSARTFVKQARSQIDAGELNEVGETIQNAFKALDKAAQKGIIHPNNAARRKSRLAKALNKARAAAPR